MTTQSGLSSPSPVSPTPLPPTQAAMQSAAEGGLPGVAAAPLAPAAPRQRGDDVPRSQIPRATFLRGFVFAWHGLVYALCTQRNARVHAAIAICAIILGVVLGISPVEFAMVFIAITLVFIAEMFNTVTEACVDLITSEYHPLARVAKDVAAGAVLLNAMLSVVIGIFVFGPHLLPLLSLLGHLFGR